MHLGTAIERHKTKVSDVTVEGKEENETQNGTYRKNTQKQTAANESCQRHSSTIRKKLMKSTQTQNSDTKQKAAPARYLNHTVILDG